MNENDLVAKVVKAVTEANKKTIEEANTKQSEDIKVYINKEVSELKQKFDEELNRKALEWDIKYKRLQDKYEKLEKELRKNNIIVFGLDAPARNLDKFITDSLNQLLNINLTSSDINNVYTLGKQTGKKPVIVKFVSYLRKQEVLRNAKKLKGSNISIAEELTLEERKENKILAQHLKKARSKKLNAFIKNQTLFVNGQKYTAKQLVEEEENTDTEDEIQENNTEEILEQTKSISAPSTPNTTKYLQEEREKEDDVFESEKGIDTTERKLVKVQQPPQRVIRSSSRLNSVTNSQTVHLNNKTPKTPQKR